MDNLQDIINSSGLLKGHILDFKNVPLCIDGFFEKEFSEEQDFSKISCKKCLSIYEDRYLKIKDMKYLKELTSLRDFRL